MTDRHILLTNDDGIDSPALLPFADALNGSNRVTVVVPDGERSWIGKAVSRHQPITLDAHQRDGRPVWTTSGTPADAVQLGAHHVTDAPIDIVVSGINVGFNHGSAFMLSSGTIGAAVEGWLAGHPAVAFSTGTWGDDWNGWRRRVHQPEAQQAWRDLSDLCVDLLGEILVSGLLDVADVVSVNLPFDADGTTPRHVTALARVGYGSLFGRGDDGLFHHCRVGYEPFGDLLGTDVEAAGDHVITITPIVAPQTPGIDDAVRDRLERRH